MQAEVRAETQAVAQNETSAEVPAKEQEEAGKEARGRTKERTKKQNNKTLASAWLDIPEPRRLTLPVVRQSLVTARERCPVYGMFTRLGIRSYGRSHALDSGSYAHTMVRILATGGTRSDAVDGCITAFNRMLADLALHPAYSGDVNNISPDTLERLRKDLNIGIVCGLIAWEPIRKALEAGHLRIIGSEFSRIVKLPLPTISTGRRVRTIRFKINLDLVFRKADGNIWLWDLKTADKSAPLSEVFANAYRRVQVWGYWRGYRVLYPSERVAGFQYQGICKPSIIQKRNQSLDDYIAECFEWHRGIGRHADKAAQREHEPTTLIQPLPMQQFQEIPTQIAQRLWDTHRFLQQSTDLSLYVPYEQSCHAMGIRCKYADFCDDPSGSTWSSTLRSRFTMDPDPLDSDPTRAHENR